VEADADAHGGEDVEREEDDDVDPRDPEVPQTVGGVGRSQEGMVTARRRTIFSNRVACVKSGSGVEAWAGAPIVSA
jgi:hypothetical protein